jgi:N-acetylglucosamine-6-phosphate deacetylase
VRALTPFALRGRILVDGALVRGAVVVRGARIAAVLRKPRRADLPRRVLDGDIVAPGFVDLQVNGGFGAEVGAGGARALRLLRERLPSTGVTTFLPTLVSSRREAIAACLADVARVQAEPGGSRIAGLHLEGPLLSPRRAGAHDPAIIEAARAADLTRALAHPSLRLVTLAPERPGALDVVRRVVARGKLASVGHTDASFEETVAAFDAGATLATHLFNAMSPFGHRAPGAAGAALLDARVTCGVIPDGFHLHPAALALALRAKGAERVALVTDAIAAAAMPPGDYRLGPLAVRSDGASARIAGGALAGSVLTMDLAVRNVAALAGPVAALRMASEVPARLLGSGGVLARGAPADLVLLDAGLAVRATLVAGEVAFTASA